MRIDIKSESEIESERAEAEAAREERAVVGAVPGVTPELLASLGEAGLDTPTAIVRAGHDALAAVPGAAPVADALYASAQEWVAARDARRDAEATPAEAPVADSEHPSAPA